jgi:hypothetical protein
MDLFGMYGSRSDDEPNSAPDTVDAVAVREISDEVSPLEDDAVTEPIVMRPSASEDAVRHFVAAMDGVEYDGQIVRPYARTGGRTRSNIALELETMLTLNTRQLPAYLSSEHEAICRLCRQTVSVAEVAAYQALPVGAARVLISDMVELGLIAATTTSTDPSGPTVDLMRRILEGLHRL